MKRFPDMLDGQAGMRFMQNDTENERLIKTAKMTYSFENTMYGTLGPERTVWDEEAHEAMLGHARKKKRK